MTWLQSFFNTPARRAIGWTALGILGLLMAAGGVYFLTDNGGGTPKLADAGATTPTATPTRTPSPTSTTTPTASPSATPTPTETATATPTSRPIVNTNTGGNTPSGGTGGSSNDQAPEPTATPTPPPVVAGGVYCPSTDQSFPPNSIFGLFKVGGADVPAGATVSLAFDGVIGPSRTTTDAGGYRVDYNAAPSNCANRVGAAISIVYNGVAYATGQTVGAGPALRFDIVN